MIPTVSDQESYSGDLAAFRVPSFEPASDVAWMSVAMRVPVSPLSEAGTLAAQRTAMHTYQLTFTQQVSSHVQSGFLQKGLILS